MPFLASASAKRELCVCVRIISVRLLAIALSRASGGHSGGI